MQNQTTHNAEYMQAIFSAILQVIDTPLVNASSTNRFRLIQQLALIGHEGVVLGKGPEDFDELAISDWLQSAEEGEVYHFHEDLI